MRHLLLLFACAAVVLGGCGGGGNSSLSGWVTTSTGLSYMDTFVGKGTPAANGDTLVVNYTGYLANGSVFDSSKAAGRSPFSFVIGQGQVIPGWDQGLLGMTAGSTRKLIIPPSLAYGSQGSGPVPPNATLYFTVDLLQVQPPATP